MERKANFEGAVFFSDSLPTANTHFNLLAPPRWGQVRIREGQWALVARPHGRDHLDQCHLHALQPQRRESGQYWGSCKENLYFVALDMSTFFFIFFGVTDMSCPSSCFATCRKSSVRTTPRSRRRFSVSQGARQRRCKENGFERSPPVLRNGGFMYALHTDLTQIGTPETHAHTHTHTHHIITKQKPSHKNIDEQKKKKSQLFSNNYVVSWLCTWPRAVVARRNGYIAWRLVLFFSIFGLGNEKRPRMLSCTRDLKQPNCWKKNQHFVKWSAQGETRDTTTDHEQNGRWKIPAFRFGLQSWDPRKGQEKETKK